MNYTKKRYIGPFKTSVSNVIKFTQTANKFTWENPVFENGGAYTINASRTTITLGGVPTGVVCEAHLSSFAGNGAAAFIWVGPLTVIDAAPTFGAQPGCQIYTGVSTTSSITGGPLNIVTNTSAQIGSRSSIASSSLTLFTNGFTLHL
jgi:hypothetical protein